MIDHFELRFNLFSEPVREKPWTKTRALVFGICGTTFVGVCALTIPFISPAFRKICLPYVPATTTQVANVLKALNGRKGRLLDIGSGDGRIVRALVVVFYVIILVGFELYILLHSSVQL